MIETICQSCGNKKTFEDSFIGRTFKCPICTNPVKVQNVGFELKTNVTSETDSFAAEIAKAEVEKKKQEKLAQKELEIMELEKNIKKYGWYAIIGLIYGFSSIIGAFDDEKFSSFTEKAFIFILGLISLRFGFRSLKKNRDFKKQR
jgi:uncharacterized Zn finger protein (UPF0148 family)